MIIITSAVNNPIFIEIQFLSFKKHIQFDYEFIVFNDAKSFEDYSNYNDITLKYKIDEMCKNLGIQCINIPNDHHLSNKNASFRTAEAMNYISEYQKKNPNQYLVIDSDMFLIDNLYKDELNYDCAVVKQTRTDYNYIWNGLYYFDTSKLNMALVNWHCTPCTDTGGRMSNWLTDAEQHNNILFINHFSSLKWDENNIELNNEKLLAFLKNDSRNKNGKFYCEIYLDKFFHYRGGGNWNRSTSLDININNLKEAILS